MSTTSTEELKQKAEKFQIKMKGRVIHRLLQKGLKANWKESDLIGFFSVMAGLNQQVKDWEWPSIDLYMVLDPKSLTTLVLCLEERRK